MIHAFNKCVLTAYSVPGTIQGLEKQQWTKQTKILSYCCLHSSGVYLPLQHLLKDSAVAAHMWAL